MRSTIKMCGTRATRRMRSSMACSAHALDGPVYAVRAVNKDVGYALLRRLTNAPVVAPTQQQVHDTQQDGRHAERNGRLKHVE